MSDSEPEGQPTGKWAVIPSGAPYNKKAPPFFGGAFLLSVVCKRSLTDSRSVKVMNYE